MNSSDRRDRDNIVKLLRRRLPDPDAKPKPTTPELMSELTTSFAEDYEAGVESRRLQARTFFDNDRKDA